MKERSKVALVFRLPPFPLPTRNYDLRFLALLNSGIPLQLAVRAPAKLAGSVALQLAALECCSFLRRAPLLSKETMSRVIETKSGVLPNVSKLARFVCSQKLCLRSISLDPCLGLSHRIFL
jgi:hypothetical protein